MQTVDIPFQIELHRKETAVTAIISFVEKKTDDILTKYDYCIRTKYIYANPTEERVKEKKDMWRMKEAYDLFCQEVGAHIMTGFDIVRRTVSE